MSKPNGTNEPVDVLLVGLGSIGSVYAYILEKSGKARVTAVARSNYDSYTNREVTLDTERFGVQKGWKPYRVVKTPAEALDGTSYAFALLTTKCLPDVQSNATLLQPAIDSPDVKAFSLIQNGLAVEADLYEALRGKGQEAEKPIVSSCAWIGIMTSSDGRTVRWRGKECLVSGIYPPPNQPASPSSAEIHPTLALWQDLIKSGDGVSNLTDDIESVRFGKNMMNASWSTFQSLTRTTPEHFAILPAELQEPIKDSIREIVRTGFASGLLKEGGTAWPSGGKIGSEAEVVDTCWNLCEQSLAKVKGGQPAHKMSMLIDVEQGRPFEVEVITGAVLKIAEKHGVSAPLLRYSYALLKALQSNILDKRKSSL